VAQSTLRATHIRELGDKARELSKLKEHPSWAVLESEFALRKQNYLASLARDLIAGGVDAEPLDQRKIDYQRGFLRGAQAVLSTPDNAIASLEKALSRENREEPDE